MLSLNFLILFFCLLIRRFIFKLLLSHNWPGRKSSCSWNTDYHQTDITTDTTATAESQHSLSLLLMCSGKLTTNRGFRRLHWMDCLHHSYMILNTTSGHTWAVSRKTQQTKPLQCQMYQRPECTQLSVMHTPYLHVFSHGWCFLKLKDCLKVGRTPHCSGFSELENLNIQAYSCILSF